MMAIKIRVEVDEQTLKKLVMDHLEEELGEAAPDDPSRIQIQVKSKQNYKSEWEEASFRAVYEHSGVEIKGRRY
jgi:hypothetical protein